jgi:hypothetical protein
MHGGGESAMELQIGTGWTSAHRAQRGAKLAFSAVNIALLWVCVGWCDDRCEIDV